MKIPLSTFLCGIHSAQARVEADAKVLLLHVVEIRDMLADAPRDDEDVAALLDRADQLEAIAQRMLDQYSNAQLVSANGQPLDISQGIPTAGTAA